MPQSLKPFEQGKSLTEQLSAERLNLILDAIQRNIVQSGDNIEVQRTPGGTIVRANLGTGGTRRKNKILSSRFDDVSTTVSDGTQQMLYTNDIGVKQLIASGDCIRATYAVHAVANGGNAVEAFVLFGSFGTQVAGLSGSDALVFPHGGEGKIKIDLLIMRTGASTGRALSIASSNYGNPSPGAFIQVPGSSPEFTISNWDDNQSISLWASVGITTDPGIRVRAQMALIEYIGVDVAA